MCIQTVKLKTSMGVRHYRELHIPSLEAHDKAEEAYSSLPKFGVMSHVLSTEQSFLHKDNNVLFQHTLKNEMMSLSTPAITHHWLLFSAQMSITRGSLLKATIKRLL